MALEDVKVRITKAVAKGFALVLTEKPSAFGAAVLVTKKKQVEAAIKRYEKGLIKEEPAPDGLVTPNSSPPKCASRRPRLHPHHRPRLRTHHRPRRRPRTGSSRFRRR